MSLSEYFTFQLNAKTQRISEYHLAYQIHPPFLCIKKRGWNRTLQPRTISLFKKKMQNEINIGCKYSEFIQKHKILRHYF